MFADWVRIGRVVDEFKIMTYSYSGSAGATRPAGAAGMGRPVLCFADAPGAGPQDPHGPVPFYGFDWHGGLVRHRRRPTGSGSGRPRPRRRGPRPSLAGGDADVRRRRRYPPVYFQDQAAMAAKLAALRARHPRVAGIALGHGSGAGGFWPLIARKLH